MILGKLLKPCSFWLVKAGGCEKHSRSLKIPRPLDEFWRKLLTLETKGVKGMTVGEPTSCKKLSKVSIYTCMYVIYVYNSIYIYSHSIWYIYIK